MAKTQTTKPTTAPPAEELKALANPPVPAQPTGALPDYLQGMAAADAGKGVSTDQADNLVPLIYVLQTNSPQVNKRDEKYVEGAEPGDILLKGAPHPVVKGEGEGAGVLFQPCWFNKVVNEWIPRNPDGSGGGFVGRHEAMPSDAIETEIPGKPGERPRKKMMSPRDTEYIETREHAGFAYTEAGPLPYIIALSSTGHQTSREWMPLMNQKRLPNGQIAPSWCALYRITSRLRKRGTQTWFVLAAGDAGPNNGPMWATAEQYARGKALYEAFASGAKQAEAPADAEGQEHFDTGTGRHETLINGDEVPF